MMDKSSLIGIKEEADSDKISEMADEAFEDKFGKSVDEEVSELIDACSDAKCE